MYTTKSPRMWSFLHFIGISTVHVLSMSIFLSIFCPCRYLIELDCESDPAWECITNMYRWLLKLLFSSKEEFQLGYVHTACEMTPLPPALSNYEAPPVVPPRIRGTSFVDRGHNRTMSDVSYASSTSSQSTGKCCTFTTNSDEYNRWHSDQTLHQCYLSCIVLHVCHSSQLILFHLWKSQIGTLLDLTLPQVSFVHKRSLCTVYIYSRNTFACV